MSEIRKLKLIHVVILVFIRIVELGFYTFYAYWKICINLFKLFDILGTIRTGFQIYIAVCLIFFKKFLNRFVNPLICILSPQKIDMVELVKRYPHIHHKFWKVVDDVLHVLKSKSMKLLRKSDKYYQTYLQVGAKC